MTNLEIQIRDMLEADSISFAELCRIDGFTGDMELLNADKNIVIWPGLSTEAAEILNRLNAEGVFHYSPTVPLVYIIDGKIPTYPIARQSRRYKKPHWLPLILNKGRRNAKAS